MMIYYIYKYKKKGLGCLTRLLTIIQLYRGSKFFIGGINQSTRRKTPTSVEVLDKLKVVSSTSAMCEIQTHNFSGDRH